MCVHVMPRNAKLRMEHERSSIFKLTQWIRTAL